MGFFSNLLKSGQQAVATYSGDRVFLAAGCAACANVIGADGQVEDNEIDIALTGMRNNPIISASFSTSDIDAELSKALSNAKSRAGRADNRAAIEAVSSRPAADKERIFLIAADVADNGGIGDEEKQALLTIAQMLGVNGEKLLQG